MRGKSLLSILLILLAGACLDRIFIDVGQSPAFPVVIDGNISNLPGPYTIQVTKAFDIESISSIKMPLSVKQMVLSDDHGSSETLSQVNQGTYQTASDGIQGIVGRVYKLRIELLDGRVYESKPDTLFPAGTVDSLYFNFKSEITEQFTPTNGSYKYGFDVFFNSTAGSKNNFHFLWNFKGTFRADTHPELCNPFGGDACEPCSNITRCNFCAVCNYRPICSGLRNISNFPDFPRAVFVRKDTCSCCTCWYNLFNPIPIVSDDQLAKDGHFNSVKAYYVPLNEWMFSHKVYIEVSQMSLSRQAFDFWRAVKGQKDAVGSLFQPITGKIPSNFVQLSGPAVPIEGLFLATAISKKYLYITREDVPNPNIIPPIGRPWNDDCRSLFANSTPFKPFYWKD